jgi:uncharacterized protein
MTSVHSTVAFPLSGYASVFNILDLGGDILQSGAFQTTITQKKRLPILWNHDISEPIGFWEELREDAYGLYVRGQISLEVQRGRELAALVKNGAIDGLSIGFRIVRARADPKTKRRRIEAVDLWEISIVTFPMNPQAKIVNTLHRP